MPRQSDPGPVNGYLRAAPTAPRPGHRAGPLQRPPRPEIAAALAETRIHQNANPINFCAV